MKKSFLLLAALVATITAHAGVSEYYVPISSFVGTNSWADTETYWNSHASAGFLEVGGLATATTAGSAFLAFEEDFDATLGAGHAIGTWETVTIVDGDLEGGSPWYTTNRPASTFNVAPVAAYYTNTVSHELYLELTVLAAPGVPMEPFRIVFEDADGALAYWPFAFPAGIEAGQMCGFQGSTRATAGLAGKTPLTGSCDFQRIRKISIAGAGGSADFHAIFKMLRITRSLH